MRAGFSLTSNRHPERGIAAEESHNRSFAFAQDDGFSLVELSIVLVILGLLTGGILTGQNLIRAAELRSVVTEFQGYQSAVNTFRDKYFALPGDMTNATDFWGAAHATPATCLTTAGTGTQTCDGNGDGQMNNGAGASQYGEIFTFWQHLANAGLIEGSYTGIAGSANVTDFEIGTNAPLSKVSNAGWLMVYAGVSPGSSDSYALDYGNFFEIGGIIADTYPIGPVFTPEEAWNIDTKIDDGRPAYGKVVARYWGTTTADNACTINAADETDLDSDYNLTDTSPRCSIHFIKAF